MVSNWQHRYASYCEEEDWDIKTLKSVNRQLEQYIRRMPGGSGDLTLAELQEMASRQQQQMEAQQQVLVAKEQRLKYLRQQEARHAQLASEGERIRKMRERVESQELKLRKLRALRGQAEQYRASNGRLNGELDAVKAVFNEKEKELAMAVARVDRLNKQLQELRNTSSVNDNNGSDNKQTAVAAELEKLRKELLIRNKLNEQQGKTISAKEKMLNQRREEVARMDVRIKELQQRLKKRQNQEALLKQQQSKKNQQDQGKGQGPPFMASSSNRGNNGGLINKQSSQIAGRSVATVEPYIQYAPQNVVKDDSYSKMSGEPFQKQDPKYQTLPARVKYSPPSGDVNNPVVESRGSKLAEMNNNEFIEEYQLPTVLPSGSKAVSSHQNQLHPAQHKSGAIPEQNQNIPQPKDSQCHDYENYFPPQPAPSQVSQSSSSSHTSSGYSYYKQGIAQQPNPAIMGGGDVNLHPGYMKSIGPTALNPVISIDGEERQAGSGQSSPASSEASSASSGGVQVKGGGDGEVNTSSIGPVSAMIERLNRTGLPQHPASHVQDRSAFTQRANRSRQNKPHSVISAQSTSSSSSSSLTTFSHGTVASEVTDGSSSIVSDQQTASSTSGVPSNASSPHLNQKPTPTYRYASKNQIANTYMGRLGSEAVDRYQRNLNQLYKNLDSGVDHTDGKQPETTEVKTSFSQASSGGGDNAKTTTVTPGSNDNNHPQFGAVSSPGYPDIASDKGSFKLNTPKQVRRRHSDSENEDLNKALQERKETEAQEHQKHKADASQPSSNKTAIPNATIPSNSVPNKTDASSSGSSSDPSVGSKSSSKGSKETKNSKIEPEKKDSVPTEKGDETIQDTPTTVNSSTQSKPEPTETEEKTKQDGGSVVRRTKSNLKKQGVRRSNNRVSFDPLALLLDASLEGELDLVKKVAVQVDDVSTPNDEGITALHNAICAGHYEIVKVLVEFGCDVNSPDSDGWTPLHCAASCNNLAMVKFLVEHGACVFATTISDQETAADKCEEEEDGYEGCSDYLYSIQEKLGITNNGEVYGVFDYQATKADELSFQIGDKVTVIRKGDDVEKEWWWAKLKGNEGYIPRNLLGLHPRVMPGPKEVSEC